jgi:hypothetical protein
MAVPFTPLFIAPGNAEIVIGCSWRWCKAMAAQLNVPVIGANKKQLIDAAKFRAALESLAVTPESEPSADPAAELRRQLGLRVVGGGG